MSPASPRAAAPGGASLIAWGLGLGAAGGALVGVIEVGWLLATAFGYFDGVFEILRLLACAVGLGAAAGACAGLLQGAAALLVESGARLLANKSPLAEWRARLVTALAIAPVAWVCAQIFRGPRAQQIAGHRLWAAVIGCLALALIYAVARVLIERMPLAGARASRLLALAALGAAVALHAANQEVLPRLYVFFHLGLDGLVFLTAELAVLALALRRRRTSGIRSLAVGVVALACGVGALFAFGRARALSTLVVEHAATLGRVLHASGRLRSAPAPVAAPVPVTPSAPQAALPPGPHLGDLDIVLITIDALRADRLTPELTPRLWALAGQGVRFRRAYTQVPHTSFSVATLLTGKHVFTQSALGLDPSRHQTLAAILKRERFKTAAFFPPSVFYIDRERLKSLEESSYGFEYVKYEYLAAPERSEQIRQFFAAEKPARAFVWVHYLEPHEPYDVHPGFTAEGASSARERYDGEVRFIDAEVGKLIDWVKQNRPRALIVVAADHGEELGEHGGNYHGTTLYDEQVRVPLVFAGAQPGLLTPREVGGAVGLVDVAPTLLSLLGVPRSLKMRGRDLGPWMGEQPLEPPPPGPVFAEIGRKKMIVSGDDKLICDLETDACQRYDLAADPAERRDLSGSGTREGELRAELTAWMAAESRYERGGDEGDAKVRRVLERGRLGERGVVRELGGLLNGAQSIGVRREAARLMAALPADPSARTALEEATRDPDRELQRWAELGLVRLDDAPAKKRVAEWAGSACEARGASGDAELCGRAALASGDVPLMGRALERAVDSPLGDALSFELQLEIIRALGATRDGRALDPLMLQLAQVRTRSETVRALKSLNDPRALDTLLRWLPAEPYIPVRAALAELCGGLARTPADRDRTRAALQSLRDGEREPAVRSAADAALGQLTDAANHSK
jgi:hypothetical protein